MLIIHYHHSDYLLWLIITLNIFYISNNLLSTFGNMSYLGGLSSFFPALSFIKTQTSEYITFMLKTDFLSFI